MKGLFSRRVLFLALCLTGLTATLGRQASAGDPLGLSMGFPGEAVLDDAGFEHMAPGPLQDTTGHWKIASSRDSQVRIVRDTRISSNLASQLLEIGGGGPARLQRVLDRPANSGRIRLSFNVFSSSKQVPTSITVSLLDSKGRTGPVITFHGEGSAAMRGIAGARTSGCRDLYLKPFVSQFTSARRRESEDIIRSTIRMIADLDTRSYAVDQNLAFGWNPLDTVPTCSFKESIAEVSSVLIEAEREGVGPLYLNALVVEGPLPPVSEIDDRVRRRRANMRPPVLPPDAPMPGRSPVRPEAFRQDIIWQTNPVLHTPDGLFEQYPRLIPRLKDLGITMVYFVPLWKSNTSPVGGLLGFPIGDGYTVNPAFGNAESFRALVRKFHESGIKVMVDFALHSAAWSSPLVREHPEWFVKMAGGPFFDGFYADSGRGEHRRYVYMYRLDFSYDEVQRAVIDMMKFWVREFDIDAIRLDVAYQMFNSATLPPDYRSTWRSSYNPRDILRRLKHELTKIKPDVLILAEAANKGLEINGADLQYAGLWRLRKALKEVSLGKRHYSNIPAAVRDIADEFPEAPVFLWGLETHDFEPAALRDDAPRGGFGKKESESFFALLSAVPGPLVLFGGQEEEDRWYYSVHRPDGQQPSDVYAFYKRCIALRKEKRFFEGHPRDIILLKSDTTDVAALYRTTSEGSFAVISSLSSERTAVKLKAPDSLVMPLFTMKQSLMTGVVTTVQIGMDEALHLDPYETIVLSSRGRR